MNAEQKERAIQLITTWRTRSITTRPDESAVYGDCMTDILQELVDAPTPEPFGYFKAEPFGWTDCAETDDGAIALFAAPPAPSVTGEELQAAFDRGLKAGNEQKDAQQAEIHRLHDLLAAPPASSVPDGWKLVPYSPTVLMLERAEYAVNNRPQPSKYEPSATPAIIFWTAMLNYAPEAPQDAEPPTDLPTWENGDDPLVSGGLIHRGVVDLAMNQLLEALK